MHFNPFYIIQSAMLLATALPFAFGLAIDERRDLVPEPSRDPFYHPPAGFESEKPGTVLRSRRVVAGFFGFIPDPVETHQILYRTTAINGSAIATVTTVFKPLFAKTDRVISWHTAMDSSATICSQSYMYRLGSNVYPSVSSSSSIEKVIIQVLLLQGYIVSVPDYEGPDAAFGAGRLAGMGILDGMRAVSNYWRQLGLTTDKPATAGVGYSGGGHATAWAAALHPVYAPELPVKGWSAGGIIANITATAEYVDGKITSAIIPVAVAGLMKPSAYGGIVQPLFDEVATPEFQRLIHIADTQCVITAILPATFFRTFLDTRYQKLGKDLFYHKPMPFITQNTTLGVVKVETPLVPFQMYHAKEDELVPYGPVATLHKAWCDNGASVKFTEYASGGHATTIILGFVNTLKFLNDAFDGKVASGCESQTILDDKLDPLALGLGLEPLVVKLINYLGTIGKKDTNLLKSLEQGKALTL